MNVVVSLGGSILAPNLGAGRIREHATVITELTEAGCTLGVVVGGGGVAREYIGAGRDLGANEIELDEIGIAVTRLNARLLIAALGDRVVPSPARTYEAAGAALRRGEVSVMGGVAPGQTTDAVSAAFAEYVDADLLVYATSVPGVFDADPNVHRGATRLDTLTPSELVDVIVGLEMNAGSAAPVDVLAAKLIERSSMRTIVLDGTDPTRIASAILAGEHDGTDVVPEGEENGPSLWTG